MNIYANEMIEINQEEAIKYFKIAIDKGSADAMNNYAIMLQNGPNFPSNKKEVIHLYQLALKLRKIDKVAIYNYAMILWDEEDLIKSDNKTSVDNSYSIKIERNETNNLFNFAILKNTADQNPCNRKEAAKYIEMSANCGYEKAMLMYAHLLRSGEYVPLDKRRAAYFYKKLVDDENVEAMLLYASMLENGESVPMDKNESQRLFKMAEKK